MSGQKKSRKAKTPLPRYIREELRMTCALKGYSALKSGKSRRLPEQYDYMNLFFHGKVPSHPPQIKLLAEGHLNYRELYEPISATVTKKKGGNTSIPPSASKLKLKDILTNYSSRSYFVGEDIVHFDLEKKNRTGPLLITGRNLHAMAVRGARDYKKALAFALHKWDTDTMQPKKSGETVEDVIQYVRRQMYQLKNKDKDKHKESSEDEDDESNESPSTPLPPSSPSNTTNTAASLVAETTDTTDKDNDGSSVDGSSADTDGSECDIPSDFVFPSFFVFVLYGPFVPPSDQLNINIIDAKDKKKGEGTRAQQRKLEAKEKELEAKGATQVNRGFTTDQRIDIENLGIQKETMMDRKHEVAMVALSLEESAMGKMVEAAERRAMQRCPTYDRSNEYWMKVDAMLKDQDQLMEKIKSFNQRIIDRKPDVLSVSDFINNPSPVKKRKAIDLEDLNSNDGDDDISDITANADRVAKVSQK